MEDSQRILELRSIIRRPSLRKKARTSESGAHTSSFNPYTSVDVDDYEVRTHSIGQKKVMRKGKIKFTIFEEMKESMEKPWENYRVHLAKVGEIRGF